MSCSTLRSTRLLALSMVFALSGCAASDTPAAEKPANAWQDEVSARIRDGARAFVASDDGFTAEAPEHGLTGHFDVDGARLAHDGDEVTVRAVGWGRAGTMDTVSPTPPKLDACIPGMEDPEGNCVQRLAYVDAGLTEWWIGTEEGFEQGWTVDAPPVGEGLLAIELAIAGATASVGDGEVWLDGDGGGQWHVSGLVAWDADGVPLDAYLDATEAGFRVSIADAGARYPITIDPVYSTASTTLTVPASTNYFGYSVSDAGDVNGDGYDDVVVGARGYSAYSGKVFVYHGSAAGVPTTADTTITQVASYGYLWSVSGAGDVNGDGYDDIIAGASYSTYSALVYHGSATGVSTTANTILTGESNSNFGSSVSGAGDVNGDGYDDVIVGAWYYSSVNGRAYVYSGSATGLSTTASTTLVGESFPNYFGYSVSGAGDVNGDGYDDVIVGAYAYDTSTGRAYVYDGSATGVSTTASATLDGETTNTYFGASVSGAGDVNGDGYADVIVGAYYYNGYTGRAYVFDGSATGVSTTASATLTGENVYDQFGHSVSGAGDLNNDGYDDVIVGAFYYSASTGRAYVYDGSATGIPTTASTTLTGESTYDEFGFSVSGAGDVNGDGYDDVLVGADYYDTSYGRAYVFHAYADADGDGYAATEDCDDTDAAINPGAAEICDAADTDEDCDGLVDDADADATGQSTFYVDADADGYGGSTAGAYCDAPSGYAADASDCDDTAADVNPGSIELCDAADTDEDCDGLADDADASATGQSTFYADTDGDGFGSTTIGAFCDLPNAYVTDSTDCDDTVAAINPDAEEVCNDVDDDCDSTIDVDATDATTWYADADGDGYTDASDTTTACEQPDGYAAASTTLDCDDADPTSSPGSTEIADDGIDQDCDGTDLIGDDTDEPDGDDHDKGDGKGGCGCATTGGADAAWPVALGLLALTVRRRRRTHGLPA